MRPGCEGAAGLSKALAGRRLGLGIRGFRVQGLGVWGFRVSGLGFRL